jgi:mono/diheme cytochrome c family protein
MSAWARSPPPIGVFGQAESLPRKAGRQAHSVVHRVPPRPCISPLVIVMKMLRHSVLSNPLAILARLGALVTFMEAAALAGGAGRDRAVDFAHDVVPVLKKHCVQCHGGKESKGGFSLNGRELILDKEAAIPGKAGESWLIDLLTSDDPDLQMPPKTRPRVPAAEIALLRAWIDQGMAWEPGFTFAERRYEPPLKPRRPELTPAVDGRTNPIDRILDADLARRKQPRPEPIDDATFLRRLSLDVTGVLPTPEQLDAFLDDPAVDKRAGMARTLLDDDRAYTEHWLTFWNDLLRNDYSGTGYIDGGRKQITRWLYQSLYENKPYDRFVCELIAPGPEAEGFIRGIQWRGTVNASQTREVQFAQNISQVFLGINMKCASCHDSFIDRWKLDESYGLAAIYATGPLEIHRCDKPTGRMARASWIFPELGAIDPDAPQPRRLEQLAALLTDPENGRTTRTIVNRLWQRLMGRGIVHPVDAMQNEPWNADLLDFLAADLADRGYDLKKTIALIVTSQAYQSRSVILDEEPGAANSAYAGPLARRMTAEQFVDAIWLITGAGPTAPDVPNVRQGSGASADSPAETARLVRSALMKNNLLMRSLGRPNREQVVTTRPALLTTLEALDLSNGQILAETLARGAANILKQHPGSGDALIDWLYRFAFSRAPTLGERVAAGELLGSPAMPQGVEDLLWAVFMQPEFQLIR